MYRADNRDNKKQRMIPLATTCQLVATTTSVAQRAKQEQRGGMGVASTNSATGMYNVIKIYFENVRLTTTCRPHFDVARRAAPLFVMSKMRLHSTDAFDVARRGPLTHPTSKQVTTHQPDPFVIARRAFCHVENMTLSCR